MHRSLARLLLSVALLSALSSCGPAAYQTSLVLNRCSLHFDGNDDFLDLGRIAAGNLLMLDGRPFTLSAWFRQEAGGQPYQRIVDKSDGVLARNGWALAVDPGERRIHFYIHEGSKGGDFISASGSYRLEKWHHVAAVARKDHLEIWIDGRLGHRLGYESGSFRLPANVATSARIGNWNHAPGREFKGWLDEISVWSVDLPGEAIEAIHAARGRGDLSRDWGPYRYSQNLVGWWRMEDLAAVTPESRIEDASGRSVPATLMPDPGTTNAPLLDCQVIPR